MFLTAKGVRTFALLLFLLCFRAVAQWTPTAGLYGGYINALATNGSSVVAGTQQGLYFTTNNGNSWNVANSGLNTSQVLSLVANGTTYFAGIAGGVFISTDNGMNWSATSTAPPNSNINAIATLGTVLFAGTNNGVYYSANNGSTWNSAVSGGPTTTINGLTIQGSNVFASVGGFGGGTNGVYVSADSGKTWTLMNTGLTNTNVRSIAVVGSNLLAATWGGGVFVSTNSGQNWNTSNTSLGESIVMSLYATNAAVYAGGGNYGAHVSTNGGANWTSCASLPFGEIHGFVESNSILFVATRSGVYSSTNSGTSWTQVFTGMNQVGVAALATSGTTVYAGTYYNGVASSTNNGTNWSSLNFSNSVPVGYSLLVNGSNIFFGNNSGMHRSTDGGATWSAATTGFLSYNPVYTFLLAGNTLYSGGSNGVYSSTDNAATWAPAKTGLPNTLNYGLGLNGNTLFVSSYGNGFYKSTNSGVSWSVANSQITSNATGYAFAKIDTAIFYGTDKGIFVSTDDGATWTKSASGYYNALARSGKYLFAGTSNSGVLASSDKGQTWFTVNTGLNPASIQSLAVVSSTLYAATNNAGVWQLPIAGAVPLLTSSSNAVNYGTVKKGDSAHITITLKNIIGFSVNTTGASVTMPNVFHVRQFTPSILNYGDSTTFSIVYAPTAFGSFTDTVTISYTGGSVKIPLSGSSPLPILNNSVSLLEFGMVVKNGMKSDSVLIKNVSVNALVVDSIYLKTASFAVNKQSLTLNQGDSAFVAVTFLPTSYGAFADTLFLRNNAQISPAAIVVSGNSPVPVVSISRSSIAFGTVVKKGIKSDSICIKNTSLNAVTIDSMYLKTSDFSVNKKMLTLNHGDSAFIAITFSPTTCANFSDTLFFRNNSQTPLVAIALSGNSPSPLLGAGALVLKFPDTRVQNFSLDTLYLKNSSLNQLTVNSLSIGTSNFASLHNMPLTILGNDSINISVKFAPSSFGTFSDTLTVTSDGGVTKILLLGSSPFPVLSPNKTVASFGTVAIGKDSTTVITIVNSSINNLKIDSMYTYSKYFRADSLYKGKVAATTDTLKFLVRFKPDSVIAYNDTLFIVNNSNKSIVKILLSGSGKKTTGITSANNLLPKQFELSNAFPNPFNPSTTIRFGLPFRSHVRMTVFNIVGQIIATLVEGEREAGYHQIEWSATVASGMYFFRMEAVSSENSSNHFVETKKMLYVR